MSDEHQIGSGLTEQELQVSSFWVRNKILLRRLGYGSLVVFSVACWGYVLWSLLDAYAISYPRESRILQAVAQNQLLADALSTNGPQPVQSSSVLTFTTTEDRKDLLTELSNPNQQWWADFTYRFDLGGGEFTPSRTDSILPGDKRYLAELGVRTSSTAIGATLQVDEIRWHRLDPNKVERDYAAFKEKRSQFEIKEVTFRNDLLINEKPVSQTAFTLVNNSAFGFWNADVYAVLLRAGTPIAVNKVTISEIKARETRTVQINWGEAITGVNETDVRLVVPLLDEKNYLKTAEF